MHHYIHIVLITALITALLAALVPSLAAPLSANNGRVLSVCPRGCPYSSINAALSDSQAGDLVQVGPGIYLEHISLHPGVSIRGQGINISIVTGADQDTVFRAYGGDIGRDTVVEGLTIIAGKSTNGGGIDIRAGASPTIRNNLITANNATPSQSFGGGIFVSGGAPLITGNVFTKNKASWAGGAIAIWDDSAAVVTANYFEANAAYQFGGGINVTNAAPSITGNTIVSNTAYYGGGVDVSGASPEFANNVIMLNTASVHGGGVYLRNGSAPDIFANSFMTNTAYYYGGGLYMDRSNPAVASNIFQFNIADTGAGIYVDRSAPSIARNSMLYNEASYHGGGLHFHGSSGTADNNTILQNTAIVGGGGVGVDGHSNATLINNIISGNAAGLQGGAFYIESAAPNVVNNMIARNTSSSLAGGIYIENATPLIRNNTIIGHDLGGNGEGIYLATHALPTIANNIIVDNGYGIFSVASPNGEDQPEITHNNVWNNHSGDIVGLSAPENISSDPLFLHGRDGAFYLSQVAAGQSTTSPSVDTGNGPSSDMGLDERTTAVQDELDQGIVDMGYHYRALSYRAFAPIIMGDMP